MRFKKPAAYIPPCRCGHGHFEHTYGEGVSGLRLGRCKGPNAFTRCKKGCPMWYPKWHDKYPSLRQTA